MSPRSHQCFMEKIIHVTFYNTQNNDDVNGFMELCMKYATHFGQ